MTEPFIGEIDFFPYNFAPADFLLCQGQMLNVQQYQALFSLVQTKFGGNGTTTFGIPNLIGTTAVGVGQASPGGITWAFAGKNGAESVTLSQAQYPQHTHNLQLPTAAVNTFVPVANAQAGFTSPGQYFAAPPAAINTTMHPSALTPYAGGGQAHENRQPYLAIMPCIATSGVYPTFS